MHQGARIKYARGGAKQFIMKEWKAWSLYAWVRSLENVARVSIVCRVAAAVVTRLRLRKLRDNVVGRRCRAPRSNSLSLSLKQANIPVNFSRKNTTAMCTCSLCTLSHRRRPWAPPYSLDRTGCKQTRSRRRTSGDIDWEKGRCLWLLFWVATVTWALSEHWALCYPLPQVWLQRVCVYLANITWNTRASKAIESWTNFILFRPVVFVSKKTFRFRARLKITTFFELVAGWIHSNWMLLN